MRLTIEPFRDFRIDISANKTFSKNHTEFFKVRDANSTNHEHLNPRDVGSYSTTFFALNTLFTGLQPITNTSPLFKQFEANRTVISDRLTASGIPHEVDGGYNEGYGRFQQDVLIPAFIAAYTDADANTMDLNLFNRLPMPNWRLTYNGLSKLKWFKDIFSSVNLTHSYTSKMNVNSFITDLDFDANDPFRLNPITFNYFTEFEIPDLVITEQLQPLIGLDVRTKNDMTARVDFKKARTLAMNFRDYQLSETRTTEFTIGFGYRIKNFIWPFGSAAKKRKKEKKKKEKEDAKDKLSGGDKSRPGLNAGDPKGSKTGGNDLDIKFDFSFRDDLTVNHLLDQENSQLTRGLQTIRISPSINYQVNSRLNLRFFFDQSRTIPKTSASFPITNTQAGVTVRFSLAN